MVMRFRFFFLSFFLFFLPYNSVWGGVRILGGEKALGNSIPLRGVTFEICGGGGGGGGGGKGGVGGGGGGGG